MTSEKIVHSHQVTITFDQDENNMVYWKIESDPDVENTREDSYEELAQAGMPLAALGIRVLMDTLGGELIAHALDKANNYRWQVHLGQLYQSIIDRTSTPPEDPVDRVEEGVVIH